MKKPSLLDRITGATEQDDFDDFFEEERGVDSESEQPRMPEKQRNVEWSDAGDIEELPVDVYQTNGFVVVKALISGVSPNNVDISLTRDMVTVKGTREDEREVEDDGYFQKELYWGSFSRTILLPEEVDVEQAEAYEKHGVLVIRLPKINKAKQTKLKVKSR
jgi:HSP20 family protein